MNCYLACRYHQIELFLERSGKTFFPDWMLAFWTFYGSDSYGFTRAEGILRTVLLLSVMQYNIFVLLTYDKDVILEIGCLFAKLIFCVRAIMGIRLTLLHLYRTVQICIYIKWTIVATVLITWFVC
jgi:hypothetical protein